MRRYLMLLTLLIGLNSPALPQRYIAKLNFDSLTTVLPVLKDTQRINALNLLAKRILYDEAMKGFTDSAASLSREALQLSKELHYNKGLGNALLNLAFVSVYHTTDFRNTLFTLQTALPLLKQSGDWLSVADDLTIAGECYHYLGKNDSAIIYFDSSAHLFQQLKDTVSSVWPMIKKGHSYFDMGSYSDSYKTLHAAQELTPKKDTLLQCFAYCHLANLFLGSNLPEIAIDYMNKIREYFATLTPAQQKKLPWTLTWGLRIGGEAFLQLNQIDSAAKIAAFLNVPLKEQKAWESLFYGQLYAAMHQYEKAIVYFRKGYQSSLRASHKIALARQANELAAAYLALKKFSPAIYYATEALKVSEKIHALLEKKNAVGILSTVYGATNDFAKAYHFTQLYKSLSDSLAPEEYKRKLALIQVKDQLEMQKKEAQLLSTQNQISRQQIKIQESALKARSLLIYIFIAALLSGSVLAILVARNIKLKKRKEQLQQLMAEADILLEQKRNEQQLTALQKEKADLEMYALRAQMNPHFIFNCLSSINRYILISKMEEASDYLTKFSRLIRLILQNSEKPFITLENELEALRLYIDLERLRFKNAFDYNITFTNAIDISSVFIPPLLIQPFTENAIWHGLMHKEGKGNLDIALEVEGKILTCTVTDNGIGRSKAASLKSKSAEKNKAMGIQITTERLALLNRADHDQPSFSVTDLIDSEGSPCGTKIVLKMEYKDLMDVTQK